MEQRAEAAFRRLPSVDRVLNEPAVRPLLDTYSRAFVVALVRRILAECRNEIAAGASPPDLHAVTERLRLRSTEHALGLPRVVINATGVILHTNLGRAPLSSDALRAMTAAAGQIDLEFDLRTGKRASRQAHVEEILSLLTGSEAAHVAVNNAAAVVLVLSALAKGKEVLVSRGQAVEIGGGFRVPAILRQSGARLVEVGTTNRTSLTDYEEAITPRTAAILHVHSSNFKILGFTESPPLRELAELAHRHGVLLVDDNGSGALLDTSAYGLAHEPQPQEALTAGADIVCFSGDKLLGGPQSGMILGTAALIRKLAGHPLARAMRPDKVTLAGLVATLLAYARGEAVSTVPVWRMIAMPLPDIDRRARAWRSSARAMSSTIDIVDGESTVGGGSLPGELLPSRLLQLPGSVTAESLRSSSVPVIARTRAARVLLDLRTVPEDLDGALLHSVSEAFIR